MANDNNHGEIKPPNGHGGARPGAGRKPTSELYAPEIAAAKRKCADHLPELLENLLELARGGYLRTKEKWERRGAITKKIYEYDDNGVPHMLEKPAYPDHPDQDELVLTERTTETADMDRAANIYLVDRILGKPTQAVELSGPDGDPISLRADVDELRKLPADELIRLHRAALGNTQ